MRKKLDYKFTKIPNTITEMGHIVINNFKSLFDSLDFSQFFNAIDNLIIDDRQKIKLKRKAKKWIKYNLCIPPNATSDMLDNPPKNTKEVKCICDTYLNKKEINFIFNEIVKLECIQSQDINETKYLFKNKKYKACCMMLFSFIDSIILSCQLPNKGRRKLPNQIEKIKIKDYLDSIEYYFIMKTFLVEILTKIYKNGNDFTNKKSSYELNRNYINHGMSHKRINKYDCCKLLLLVYYSSDLFNFENIKY